MFPSRSIPTATNREISSTFPSSVRSLAHKAHEDDEPIRLERLSLVEVELLPDELLGLLQSFRGEGKPQVLQDPFRLGPGVATLASIAMSSSS